MLVQTQVVKRKVDVHNAKAQEISLSDMLAVLAVLAVLAGHVLLLQRREWWRCNQSYRAFPDSFGGSGHHHSPVSNRLRVSRASREPRLSLFSSVVCKSFKKKILTEHKYIYILLNKKSICHGGKP